VWTDTLQFGAMLCALFVVMTLGTLEVGGVTNMLDIAEKGGRLIWFKYVLLPTKSFLLIYVVPLVWTRTLS
jgi:Na+/proline symporter